MVAKPKKFLSECMNCHGKMRVSSALDKHKIPSLCSTCIREAYDFDKSQYRGLHHPNQYVYDDMANDPDKKKQKFRLPRYYSTKDGGMKKTDSVVKKTRKRNGPPAPRNKTHPSSQ